MRTGLEALDHLLIGAPSLEQGMAWLAERTGVRAAMGGSHPGLGTWNALASLGPRQYLEIIAPDPGQPALDTFYVPGLRNWTEPKAATWAATGVGLASAFEASRPEEFSCEPARRGSRVRPDGTRLAWTLAFPRHVGNGNFGGALPFLIEWDSLDPHPGGSAPPGLALRSLRFEHPDPGSLGRALRALGIEVAVSPSPVAAIRVGLDTPRGPVVL